MKRGNWLKARREELKNANKETASEYSLRAVAERVGVSSAGISNLELNHAMPTLDLAMRISELYGKSVEWVLTGKETATERGIPIVGTISDGPAQEFTEHGLRFPDEWQYVDMPNSIRRRLYALRIDNDASSTAYRAGDLAIFDPAMRPIVGEDHLVKCTNGDTVGELMMLINANDEQYVFASVSESGRRLVKDIAEVSLLLPVFAVAKCCTIRKA